jgi:antitoxin HigA-1
VKTNLELGGERMTPGSFIREAVLPEGLSVSAAAARLGVGRQALDALLNGRAGLSAEMALRLERVFGPSAELLMRHQMNYELSVAATTARSRIESLVPYEVAD